MQVWHEEWMCGAYRTFITAAIAEVLQGEKAADKLRRRGVISDKEHDTMVQK